MDDNPSAPAGKSTKYARPEHERRFLLATLPAGVPTRTVAIEDRYFVGTTLRLRRVECIDPAGDPTLFKLTQKVPAPDGGPGLLTNTYLSKAEHAMLATLPAAVLTKTRHSYPPLGVDVFTGALAGLLLAEAEFDTEEECRAYPPPEFAVAEVTYDQRFTGGRLAVTDEAGLRQALQSFGIRLP